MSAIGLKGGANPEGWVPAKAVGLAAVLGALLLASLTVNTLTIAADGKRRQGTSSTAECQAVGLTTQPLDGRHKLAEKPASADFHAPSLRWRLSGGRGGRLTRAGSFSLCEGASL
ncbi:hypothetical protein [Bradyrhizobium sp.]|uniref:hypothetical protein n=1 Tax=Bradyrhizobium sp. TaxID=376 RepID=UPI002D6D661A|nr:hypothetical protein [Bradyrhizobium sp.]HZR74289.1 hypothetical protein [Bradyrhizobium sp.]